MPIRSTKNTWMKSSTWQTTPMLPITIRLSNSSRNTATTRLWFFSIPFIQIMRGTNTAGCPENTFNLLKRRIRQIGISFFKKLRQEDLFNDTHFLFLTDHGGIGKGHGGTSAAEMIVPWGISGPGIKRNFLISEPNNTTNTAPMLLHLFGGKPLPEWTGKSLKACFHHNSP